MSSTTIERSPSVIPPAFTRERQRATSGRQLTPDSLVLRPYPGGVDATIDPARFRQIFAADLSPVAQGFFAQRMGAHTTSIDASHAGYISHPTETAKLIETAARATS
jgi:hypothetical protein